MITASDRVWARRVIAGTFTIHQVPSNRIDGVKEEIVRQHNEGEISDEVYAAALEIEINNDPE